MVRLNKDKGKIGVYDIGEKEDVQPSPKEPILPPQSSTSEL